MMSESDFLLQDRITKIKSINELYNLEGNAYISFSGGKDSTVLSWLIDMALPKNNIPRVYVNTGLDYQLVKKFVDSKMSSDARFISVCHGKNIIKELKVNGYPFKSKTHSTIVDYCQTGKTSDYIDFYFHKISPEDYKGHAVHRCPKKLLYQYSFNGFRISANCCIALKERPLTEWAKSNSKTIFMTGMRGSEGGRRASKSSCIIMKGQSLRSFNPLFVVDDATLNTWIDDYKIDLADIYKPPYNFNRTGCKGCPFSLSLQETLDKLEKWFPNEKKQCEMLWKPVYEEYRKIGYRLRPLSLFD